MSMLLEWDKNEMSLKIREEIKGIKVFRRVIENDNSLDKSRTIMLFSYLYFMHNPLSDYMDMYEDEEERKQKVLEDMGISESAINSKLNRAAEEYYKERTKNKSLKIVQDNMSSIENLRQFMVDFNLNDVDIKDRMSSAKGKADLIRSLNALAVDTENALRKLKKDFDESNPLLEDKRSVGDRIELNDDDIEEGFA